jgi:DNA-binding transcriptional LysR family regulator
LSPAAVSKNVAKLEQQLKLRLFNRTTRSVKLTPEGAAYLEKAREALRLLDDAAAQVSAGQHQAIGRVRISSAYAFGRRFVSPVLPGLLQSHPQLQVELSLDNREVDLVAEGFDMGVRGGVVRDSAMVARRVCKLSLVLVASPAYLAKNGIPRSVADLSKHQALGVRFGSGHSMEWQFGRGIHAQTIIPNARLWSSDPESLLDWLLADVGIAQISLSHAWPHLLAGRLKVLLHAQHAPGEREVVLFYPHRQFLAPRVRVVVDALMSHYESEPAFLASYADAAGFCA